MTDLLNDLRDSVIDAARELRDTARDLLGSEDEPTEDDVTEEGHALAVKPADIDPTGDPHSVDEGVSHATVGTLGAVHPTPAADTAVSVRLEQHPNGWHVHSETSVFDHTIHPHVEDAELFVRHRAHHLDIAVIIERHPLHDDGLPESRVDMAHGVAAPTTPAMDEDSGTREAD